MSHNLDYKCSLYCLYILVPLWRSQEGKLGRSCMMYRGKDSHSAREVAVEMVRRGWNVSCPGRQNNQHWLIDCILTMRKRESRWSPWISDKADDQSLTLVETGSSENRFCSWGMNGKEDLFWTC